MVWSEENLGPTGVVIWLGFGAPTADQRQRLTQAVGAAHPRHGSRVNRPHLDHGRTLELSRATAFCLVVDAK
jgi:hypothetical protein